MGLVDFSFVFFCFGFAFFLVTLFLHVQQVTKTTLILPCPWNCSGDTNTVLSLNSLNCCFDYGGGDCCLTRQPHSCSIWLKYGDHEGHSMWSSMWSYSIYQTIQWHSCSVDGDIFSLREIINNDIGIRGLEDNAACQTFRNLLTLMCTPLSKQQNERTTW